MSCRYQSPAAARRHRFSPMTLVAIVIAALAGGCGGHGANVSHAAPPATADISSHLREGNEVIVAGVEPALHGTYRAHPISAAVIDLYATRLGGAALYLSPHFSQLHDSQGRPVDLWSVCNVTINWRFEYLAELTVTQGHVVATLDYG